jgi:hypothetical protein
MLPLLLLLVLLVSGVDLQPVQDDVGRAGGLPGCM